MSTRTATLQLINGTPSELTLSGQAEALAGTYKVLPDAKIAPESDAGYTQWEMEAGPPGTITGANGKVTYVVPYITADKIGKEAQVEIEWKSPYEGENSVVATSSVPDRIYVDVSDYPKTGDLRVVMTVRPKSQ